MNDRKQIKNEHKTFLFKHIQELANENQIDVYK